MTEALVTVSTHAEQRWPVRADLPAARETEPGEAWQEAVAVDGLDEELDADEVRYHRPSMTLLVRQRHTLVTVLSVVEEDSRLQAALRQQGGERA